MDGYPFLEADLGSEYENKRGNIIGKVRAYHENREYYEQVCRKFPEHRLAFDRGDVKQKPKRATRAERVKQAIKKDSGQKGLFDGN